MPTIVYYIRQLLAAAIFKNDTKISEGVSSQQPRAIPPATRLRSSLSHARSSLCFIHLYICSTTTTYKVESNTLKARRCCSLTPALRRIITIVYHSNNLCLSLLTRSRFIKFYVLFYILFYVLSPCLIFNHITATNCLFFNHSHLIFF